MGDPVREKKKFEFFLENNTFKSFVPSSDYIT